MRGTHVFSCPVIFFLIFQIFASGSVLCMLLAIACLVYLCCCCRKRRVTLTARREASGLGRGAHYANYPYRPTVSTAAVANVLMQPHLASVRRVSALPPTTRMEIPQRHEEVYGSIGSVSSDEAMLDRTMVLVQREGMQDSYMCSRVVDSILMLVEKLIAIEKANLALGQRTLRSEIRPIYCDIRHLEQYLIKANRAEGLHRTRARCDRLSVSLEGLSSFRGAGLARANREEDLSGSFIYEGMSDLFATDGVNSQLVPNAARVSTDSLPPLPPLPRRASERDLSEVAVVDMTSKIQEVLADIRRGIKLRPTGVFPE
jgi:hypothetical protein